MTARTFVDTTVLVYSKDASYPEKQARARAWLDLLWRERAGRISLQVCNEYYVTVTKKLKPGLAQDTAWSDVVRYQAWEPLAVDFEILTKARETQSRYGLSWWDSLIVSAAHRAECQRLLSEDLSTDQLYWGIGVVNPFVTEPR